MIDYVARGSGSHPVRRPERSHPIPQRFVAATVTFWCAHKDKDGNERPYRLDKTLADSNLRESDRVDIQIPADLAEQGFHMLESPLSEALHEFALEHHLDTFTSHYKDNLEYACIGFVLELGSIGFLGPDERSSYDPMTAPLRDTDRAFSGGAYASPDIHKLLESLLQKRVKHDGIRATYKNLNDRAVETQPLPLVNSRDAGSCVFDVMREFYSIQSLTDAKNDIRTFFELDGKTEGAATLAQLLDDCRRQQLILRVFKAATGELVAFYHPSMDGKAKSQKYACNSLNAVVAHGHLQLVDKSYTKSIEHAWPWNDVEKRFVPTTNPRMQLSISADYRLPTRTPDGAAERIMVSSAVEIFEHFARWQTESDGQEDAPPPPLSYDYYKPGECSDLRELIGELSFAHNVILSSLNGDRKTLSFDIVKKRRVFVQCMVTDSEGELKPDLEGEDPVAYREMARKMDFAGMTQSALNNYSQSLKLMMDQYPVKPLTGRVPGVEMVEGWEHLSADGFREYLSCLLTHSELPRFTVFDEFVKYVPGDVWRALSLHVARAKDGRRDEYFHEGIRLCYGRNLTEYVERVNTIDFEVDYVCHPVMSVSTAGIKAMIEEIDADDRLSGKSAKDIVNKFIGKLGRTHKKESRSWVFHDEQEARRDFEERGKGMRKEVGAWKYTDDDTRRVRIDPLTTKLGVLFVVKEEMETEYEQGFRPWNHLVKDTSHLRLAIRSKLFRAAGYVVAGYKTDEIWLTAPCSIERTVSDLERGQAQARTFFNCGSKTLCDVKAPSFPDDFFSSATAGLLDNLGKVKPLTRMDPQKIKKAGCIASDRFADPIPLEFARAGDARCVWTRADMTVARFSEAEELEVSAGAIRRHMDKFFRMDTIRCFLIRAVFPGAGKSMLCKNFIARHRKIKKAPKDGVDYPTALFLCPGKAMVERLRREGWRADTLCRFFGFNFQNTAVASYSDKQIRELQIVVLEEIYMYSVDERQAVYRFMRRYPDIMVVANGDPLQLPPIEGPMLISGADRDVYQADNITAMFPQALSLKINRSMKDPYDRLWLGIMHKMLFPEEYPEEYPDGGQPVPYLEINAAMKAKGFAGFQEFHSLEECPVTHPDGIRNIACLNDTISKLTNDDRRRGGRETCLPEPGDEITCRVYMPKSGGRPAVNNQSDWTVETVGVDEESKLEYWTLLGEDKETRITIGTATFCKHFSHTLGCTSYKTQGDRTDKFVVMHDLQRTDLIGRKHFWMCLTRGRSLNKVALCILPAKTDIFKADHKMMAVAQKGMAAKNKIAGRDKEPVATLAGMKTRMKIQKWQCAGCCGRMLDTVAGSGRIWETDRTDPHRGYTDSNIQFLCRSCNGTKGGYERSV